MFNPISAILNVFHPEPGDLLPFDPPELDEGSPVVIHGELADYYGIVIEILNVNRCRVRWYCDIRNVWFESAVDIDRCEYYNWQVLS